MTPESPPPGPARPQPPRRPALPWAVAAGLLAALLVAAVVCAMVGQTRPTAAPPPANSLPSVDPRVAYTGPYLNVRSEVGYVGDERCAGCHHDFTESYGRHPMAHSLTPISRLAATQSYGPELHNPFEAFGSRFEVVRQGDVVRHKQTRLDGAEHPLYENEMDVQYAIGSGIHGYSYLTVRGGYVFQTPVSWFEQKRIWDLSPNFSPKYFTGRPVISDCLFCHANRTRPLEGTVNRYEEPVFEGCAIGCERCHGPGERHARDPGRDPMTRIDPTIVNPVHLPPDLREAVCNQCHLEGVSRIVRRGRGVYDFRPGLPLGAFLSVWVKPAAAGADRKAVNHVEQMEQSGCFRGGTAEDRIGCTSCHDPHDFVGPDRRTAYYREACLNCHGRKQRGCSVPIADRRRTSADDSCIQCHMPPYSTSDIAHAASTDHRIPRRPNRPDAPAKPEQAGADTQTLLALIHPDGLDAKDPEYRRDLGLALIGMLAKREYSDEAGARAALAESAPVLDGAVKDFPDDAECWEDKARVALAQNRAADALPAFEAALALAPKREGALMGAAQSAHALGKDPAALDYWRRAVDVDPWAAASRGGYAGLLAARAEWGEARNQAREWVRILPEDVDARKLLIRCLLKTGDKPTADAELKTLKGLLPGWEQDLDFWFAKQQR